MVGGNESFEDESVVYNCKGLETHLKWLLAGTIASVDAFSLRHTHSRLDQNKRGDQKQTSP